MKQAIINNIFMIIVALGYTIFAGRHFINYKKNAGAKIKQFKHKSGIKMMGYVMVFFGVFYAVMFMLEKDKTPTIYLTAFLFLYFIVIISAISIRDICLYENGLYYSGKYVSYNDMLSVDKVGKNGVQIKLVKKFLTDIMYLSKVEKEGDFIGTLRSKIKVKKKSKKNK